MADGFNELAHRAESAGLVLLSDRPVADGGQEDLLNRAAEASALADLVRASRSAAPFTLAVFADWGMGKSSLLSQVATELKATGDVDVVWFNAWATRGGQGLEALVKAVLDRLDRRSLRRLARAVSGDSDAASWFRVLARGLAGAFALHHLVDGIWEKLAVDARTRNDAQLLLRKTLEDWTVTESTTASGRTIVVFVDDLDRCPPETIATVSSAMKQYLNIPGLVFVLACDQRIIEAAAQGSEASAREVLPGRRFLEKVIQASYTIPAPTDAQMTDLVAGYAREAGAADLFRGPVGEAVVQHVGRNPRRVKRLINRFVIEYHLDPEWRQLGAEALVRVAVLQDFYPEFDRLLSLAGELDPIESFGDYVAVVRAQKHGLPEDDEERARVVRTLMESGSRTADEVTLQAVAELERNLPEQFPLLARDKTFVSLVEYLVNLPTGEQLRVKLRRSGGVRDQGVAHGGEAVDSAQTFPPSFEASSHSRTNVDLVGLKILRLSSREMTAGGGSLELDRRGASVTWTSTVDEAVEQIRRGVPDAVITNLMRPGSDDGGFEDIEAIRAFGYSGLLIIYTGYVSPSRRERAEQLGVLISAQPFEVLDWLAAIPVNPPPRTTTGYVRDMENLHVLWYTTAIDQAVQRNFESRGALITVAHSAESAASAASRERPDVLVIEGVSLAEAGIEAVRRNARYAGPIVIFTSRVSPDRRDLAQRIAAEITDDSADLAEQLARTATDLKRHHAMGDRPTSDLEAARIDYDKLVRSALQLQEVGEIDRAEQRWSSAEYLAHTHGDIQGTLRAMVMRAGFALRRRRYALAIGRYNYAVSHGAVDQLDRDLITALYNGLGSAHAAIGDVARAAEARATLAEYLNQNSAL